MTPDNSTCYTYSKSHKPWAGSLDWYWVKYWISEASLTNMNEYSMWINLNSHYHQGETYRPITMCIFNVIDVQQNYFSLEIVCFLTLFPNGPWSMNVLLVPDLWMSEIVRESFHIFHWYILHVDHFTELPRPMTTPNPVTKKIAVIPWTIKGIYHLNCYNEQQHSNWYNKPRRTTIAKGDYDDD